VRLRRTRSHRWVSLSSDLADEGRARSSEPEDRRSSGGNEVERGLPRVIGAEIPSLRTVVEWTIPAPRRLATLAVAVARRYTPRRKTARAEGAGVELAETVLLTRFAHGFTVRLSATQSAALSLVGRACDSSARLRAVSQLSPWLLLGDERLAGNRRERKGRESNSARRFCSLTPFAVRTATCLLDSIPNTVFCRRRCSALRASQ
jgi:hypothetical protein